jgi:biotin-dependent carboxylase-like uncharacterized protein
MSTLEVVRPGVLTTYQDLGRPRMARLGVPQAGAFDRGAVRRANRLLGNNVGATALECTLGGLVLRAERHVLVAITGADVPIDVDGTSHERGAPITLAPGSTLTLGTARAGLRAYVAVRGGLEAPAELGSSSYDSLSHLGPPPLAEGDLLEAGSAALFDPVVDHAPEPPLPTDAHVRVRLGPRADRLTDGGLTTLGHTAWTVSPDSDRVGLRLQGPALELHDLPALASEPTVRGAVQVPPDGHPVVFGPDHPTTGGYPVVAVVAHEHLDLLAQLRPGDALHLDVSR